MELIGPYDILVFVAFVAAVLFIGLWMSKGEDTSSEHGAQDYFLAGRGLTWWLVGFSLIAANISTEQFVGMSGQAADWLGMAIASYEWMAAITLVVVAFVFLPTFLRSGIYTIPEFLEYRYNSLARLLMAVCTLVILVGVPTASVIYSGAKVITVNFQGATLLGIDFGNIATGCYIIGVMAAVYVFAGGLKACAWADLLQGSALIMGGIIIAVFAMSFLAKADPNELIKTARNKEVTVQSLENAGAVQRFWDLNRGPTPEGKTHMVRPLSDKRIPWTRLAHRALDPELLLLGFEPVHHAAYARLEVSGRRTERSRVRRLTEIDHPLHCRDTRNPRLQSLQYRSSPRCRLSQCPDPGREDPRNSTGNCRTR